MAVAQSLIDAGAGVGIESSAILSHNRDVSVERAEAVYVDYTTNCPREWFSRCELARDVVAGRIGLLRPNYGRLYDPATTAAFDLSADMVLLYEGHYASATLPRWSQVRRRCKVVLYVHNPLSRSYSRRELRRLLSHADAVIFCADHLREDVEERLGSQSVTRLLTIHNGVGAEFSPASREPEEEFRIVFAGRPTAAKGVHLVLEAVKLAERRIDRPMHVQVIGSDSYGHRVGEVTSFEQDLHSVAGRLKTRVEFLPFMPKTDLAAHLRRADVACLPSQWAEGLPLSALEAMASGAAVITSDSPGMLEAVGDAGLIAPAGDPAVIAEHLVALASTPDGLEAAKHSALRRAEQFSWSKAAAAMAQLAVG
ncbi:glycosyltransferase family 4 protein [Microbacterium horticulturae]|uniref:Glycosyltransferase family 4 protein n=1 Tax=Microbacterium horticulturae TaxID=3028316 RepID=A0ABY8BYB2_9MICO|nr:glycosyltransferase family 4 protein [Microbacterium sp. KACC 23027]WEG09191.1 glycosyltransferase family 4 protein [Microbacterium sp. KACC 23027]